MIYNSDQIISFLKICSENHKCSSNVIHKDRKLHIYSHESCVIKCLKPSMYPKESLSNQLIHIIQHHTSIKSDCLQRVFNNMGKCLSCNF